MAEAPLIIPGRAIPRERLDPDALDVCERLHRAGHEAYLVGGCVRDLLLDTPPKDFDVATSATPRQVRRLFHNARVIGRRFRLVHVVFGQKVIEVATFRAEPLFAAEEDGARFGPEVQAYGTAEEDARLRDFTVNALFYDPIHDEIIDYVGGIEDLRARCVRAIGDPVQRMAEDPVRIIRAVRMAAKLGLTIERDTAAAIVRTRDGIANCSRRRLFEEILKILLCGASEWAFRMMDASGVLPIFIPEIAAPLEESFPGDEGDGCDEADHPPAELLWRYLARVDRLPRSDATTPVVVAALFLPAVRVELERSGGPPLTRPGGLAEADAARLEAACQALLGPFAQIHSISKRDRARAQEILCAQRHLLAGIFGGGRDLRDRDYFPEALTLLKVMVRAEGLDEAGCRRLGQTLRASEEAMEAASPPTRPPRRRRRRRRARGGPPD